MHLLHECLVAPHRGSVLALLHQFPALTHRTDGELALVQVDPYAQLFNPLFPLLAAHLKASSGVGRQDSFRSVIPSNLLSGLSTLSGGDHRMIRYKLFILLSGLDRPLVMSNLHLLCLPTVYLQEYTLPTEPR